MDPKQRTYPSGSKAYKYTWSAGTVSILLFIVTVYFVIEAWRLRDPFAIYVLAAIWAVTPPIWFWFEYHFVYRKYGETGTMEFFKHGQQV
nr:hypothetical protein [Acidobacteriota bacterium]